MKTAVMLVLSLIFLTIPVLVMPGLILEYLKALPILPTIVLLMAASIKHLTPNPKKHSVILGVVFAEVLEHFGLPIIVILSIITIPTLWIPAFMLATYVIYGRVLGTVKTRGDYMRIYLLSIALITIIQLPDITRHLNYRYGIAEWSMWMTLTITALGLL